MRQLVILLSSAVLISCGHAAPTQHHATPSRTDEGRQRIIPRTANIPEVDRYLAVLRASRDPIGPYTANLIADLSRDLSTRVRECAENDGGPFRIAIVGWSSLIEEILADDIAVGLGNHPSVRISNRHAIGRIEKTQREEHDGQFDDATIQRIGAYHGIHALGIVKVRGVHQNAIATAHLVCTRTLIDVVSARTTVPGVITAPFRTGPHMSTFVEHGVDLFRGLNAIETRRMIELVLAEIERGMCERVPHRCKDGGMNAKDVAHARRHIRDLADCAHDPTTCCDVHPDLPGCPGECTECEEQRHRTSP